MAKIMKSVRLEEGLLAYVETKPGKGFSEQLENLISESRDFESERLARIEKLDNEIGRKIDVLNGLDQKADEWRKEIDSMRRELIFLIK